MTVETHQQIKRMDTLLLGIKEAAVAGDLDRIARLEHAIKHISLEMFASIDVTVEQPNGVLNATEEAVSTLREVSRVLSRRRAAMGEKLKQDRQIRLVYSRGHHMTLYKPCARCTMTRIKLFMVVGVFMMGLIYSQPQSAILLAAQFPATEVIAGIIVVLVTVGFALRYYQMDLAQAQNKSDL